MAIVSQPVYDAFRRLMIEAGAPAADQTALRAWLDGLPAEVAASVEAILADIRLGDSFTVVNVSGAGSSLVPWAELRFSTAGGSSYSYGLPADAALADGDKMLLVDRDNTLSAHKVVLTAGAGTTIDAFGGGGASWDFDGGAVGYELTYDKPNSNWIPLLHTGGTAYTSPTTTKGDLLVRGASSDARLAVGANGTVPTADSAAALGISYKLPGSVQPTNPDTSNAASAVSHVNGLQVSDGTFAPVANQVYCIPYLLNGAGTWNGLMLSCSAFTSTLLAQASVWRWSDWIVQGNRLYDFGELTISATGSPIFPNRAWGFANTGVEYLMIEIIFNGATATLRGGFFSAGWLGVDAAAGGFKARQAYRKVSVTYASGVIAAAGLAENALSGLNSGQTYPNLALVG